MTNRKISRESATGKLVGVSTTDDVKAFRSANTALMNKVTSSRDAARTYVRELEKRAGITPKKK
jgi:hypothetical protein